MAEQTIVIEDHDNDGQRPEMIEAGEVFGWGGRAIDDGWARGRGRGIGCG
jgi:hypothetical protein